MSDTGILILEAANRLLAEHLTDHAMQQARDGVWSAKLWDAAIEQGLHLALVRGEQGFWIAAKDGLALIETFGRHAVTLPLPETMAGNALLARVGLPVLDQPIALVQAQSTLSLRRTAAGWHVSGTAERVPWGRRATALVVESDGKLALVTTGVDAVEFGYSLARVPMDTVCVDAPAQVAAIDGTSVLEVGALMRALTMAGAMQSLVAMTIAHVTQRTQFGRPLAAFQAVQHSLARLAAEAAAAAVAADLAAQAFADDSAQTAVAIAAARARISDAAGAAIGIAHQLHGAIGFTEEHRLHWFTTALWAWRDEFGSAAWWTRQLGAAALGNSKAGYWPFVTSV